MNYWNWRPEGGNLNFGDELTGVLLKEIFPNQPHKWVEPEEADIIAVGSVINTLSGRLKPGTAIWGSGGGYKRSDAFGNLNFLAVRGEMTRDNLNLAKSIPLGDPAILLPKYFPGSKKKIYKLGYVKHMGDNRPTNFNPDLVIPCLQHPVDVINQITSCEMIITSSLHGWIIAMAYGIPSVPWPLDDGNKFMDFTTSLHSASLESLREPLLNSLLEWESQRS